MKYWTGAGFFDPHGWCDERQVPLILDGMQRQSSARIRLDPIRPNDKSGKTTNTASQSPQDAVEEDSAASCVELMIVNELRGAEGDFWLTLHSSSGELTIKNLPPPTPTAQQAAAMARDTGRTDTDLTVAFQEEEEVGAELISVLTQQQRCVDDVYNDRTARAYTSVLQLPHGV